MDIDIGLIQDLRRVTNLGISDCKQALEATNGVWEKAIIYLKEQNKIKQNELANRENNEGIVVSYVHPDNQLGVLLQINCESVFVVKTDKFKELAKDIAMHIAACRPLAISREEISDTLWQEEIRVVTKQVENDPKHANKNSNLIHKIVEGKMNKFYQENCLLEQKFVKDEKKTIKELLDEATAIFKEKIEIKKFSRFSL